METLFHLSCMKFRVPLSCGLGAPILGVELAVASAIEQSIEDIEPSELGKIGILMD